MRRGSGRLVSACGSETSRTAAVDVESAGLESLSLPHDLRQSDGSAGAMELTVVWTIGRRRDESFAAVLVAVDRAACVRTVVAPFWTVSGGATGTPTGVLALRPQ